MLLPHFRVSSSAPAWEGSREGHIFRAAFCLLPAAFCLPLVPQPGSAHPMGNFSISHYAGIRIERDVVRLRYLIDMAEIPAFQEIQAGGIAPEPNHPGLPPYLARTAEAWTEGLWLEVDGRRLTLRPESSDIGFPPGAGGLPTLKVSVTYRATLPASTGSPLSELRYRDTNFRDRAGWKEIVAAAGAGATLTASSMLE